MLNRSFKEKNRYTSKDEKTLDNKMIEEIAGIVLIIVGIMFAVAEHVDKFYGRSNEWYFYGLAAIIVIIGLVLLAWGYMKSSSPKKPA